MVALIDLFKADTAAADAYLALKWESLWKVWIHKWLVHDLGFPDEWFVVEISLHMYTTYVCIEYIL